MQKFILILTAMFLIKYIASGFESHAALMLFAAFASVAAMRWYYQPAQPNFVLDHETKIADQEHMLAQDEQIKSLVEENEQLQEQLKNKNELKSEIQNLNEIIIENSRDFSAERQKSEEKDLKISEIEKSLQNSESHLKTARKALGDIKYLSVAACTTIDQKRIFADKGLPEIEATLKKISKKAEFQIKKEKSQS